MQHVIEHLRLRLHALGEPVQVHLTLLGGAVVDQDGDVSGQWETLSEGLARDHDLVVRIEKIRPVHAKLEVPLPEHHRDDEQHAAQRECLFWVFVREEAHPRQGLIHGWALSGARPPPPTRPGERRPPEPLHRTR